jgi:hypothetical protein
MDRMDRIQDIALRMEDLCADAGIPRFDRVRFKIGLDEVWFLWEERKLAVVVELGADAAHMAESFAQVMAGDPVMN